MSHLNSVNLAGWVQREPEFKHVGPKETALLTFDLANPVGFKDNKHTNYFKLQLWGKMAESLRQYITEGKYVIVSGSIKQERYEDKDGNKRQAYKVDVRDFHFGGQDSEPKNTSNEPSKPAPRGYTGDDSEIPF